MSKGIYQIFRTKEEFEVFVGLIQNKYIGKGIDIGTAFSVDMALIALGRMGEGVLYDEFMRTMEEAVKDYGELINSDAFENHDKDLWYSADTLDKELISYLEPQGIALKESFDERYKR